jgi:hypothetical protein
MTLEDSDILLGKIAIGRALITRDDARRIVDALAASARAGRRETFSGAAVRLGYLDRGRISELNDILTTGELVCRGSCGRRTPLRRMRPDETSRCGACGGPLYLAGRSNGNGHAPDLAPAVADEPPDEPRPGNTIVDLSIPDLGSAKPPAELATPGHGNPRAGDSDEATLEFDAPPGAPQGGSDESTLEFDPGSARTVARGIDPQGGPALGPLEQTWRSDPKGEAFEPFALGPDLTVTAPIGRGGMGSVFRARTRDGRTVAVKILVASTHPDVLARFEREVKLSASLDHPNIVKVFSTGTVPAGPDAGKPYFVMDYIPGRDLGAWLAERSHSLVESVRTLMILCGALEHAHARGVVHRDIKPGNVLIREGTDQPMLCDFGLARYRAEIQSLTQTGDIIGTPSYMPPEQALGHRHKIGPPTDVYALGALLYHLVTGRPPFLGATAFLTIAKVIKDPPDEPRKHNPKVPPALEAVILKAMQKEPVNRFHTCADLRVALEAIAPTLATAGA